jgi:hypothetical protein
MTPEDGTVGLGERFAKVEALLERIDTKLDKKVDVEVFMQWTHRVELLESGDTPVGKFWLEQFRKTQDDVRDLRDHGSTNAREAVKEIAVLRADVSALKQEGSNARAVLHDKQSHLNRSYRLAGLGLFILGLLDTALSIAALVTHHA